MSVDDSVEPALRGYRQQKQHSLEERCSSPLHAASPASKMLREARTSCSSPPGMVESPVMSGEMTIPRPASCTRVSSSSSSSFLIGDILRRVPYFSCPAAAVAASTSSSSSSSSPPFQLTSSSLISPLSRSRPWHHSPCDLVSAAHTEYDEQQGKMADEENICVDDEEYDNHHHQDLDKNTHHPVCLNPTTSSPIKHPLIGAELRNHLACSPPASGRSCRTDFSSAAKEDVLHPASTALSVEESGVETSDEERTNSPGGSAGTNAAPVRGGGEVSGSGRKSRKARTAFSDHQLQTLEKSFERQKYLSVQDRMELATKLNLSDTQVKTWYQNRRTKWKRQTAVGLEMLGDATASLPVIHRLCAANYWPFTALSNLDYYWRQAAVALNARSAPPAVTSSHQLFPLVAPPMPPPGHAVNDLATVAGVGVNDLTHSTSSAAAAQYLSELAAARAALARD